MPFIPNTPESLLPRSDSKNPAATCRGLTATGRPCRRALSKSPHTSPTIRPVSSPRRGPSPEAYCWQHKEQAASHSPPPENLRPGTIKERTSIDTLIDRLGVLEVEAKYEGKTKRKQVPITESEKPEGVKPIPRPGRQRPRPKPKASFCCFGVADESKRAPRPVKSSKGRQNTVPVPAQRRSTLPNAPKRPPIIRDPSSRTGEFLSLIPPSASPETTARLLTELNKPFSDRDDDGFIYMFWLTPENLPSAPPADTAISLLAPPSKPRSGQRRASEVLNTFASHPPNTSKKTILLKIGRAQNVQRRLNQWTRQCGYNLTLIRYYPYQPTTLSGTGINELPQTPRRVPNANRVERLIHIELSGKRSQDCGKCVVCGREHREWFEVDASKDGLAVIDEVVRRWVGWGEREAVR